LSGLKIKSTLFIEFPNILTTNTQTTSTRLVFLFHAIDQHPVIHLLLHHKFFLMKYT